MFEITEGNVLKAFPSVCLKIKISSKKKSRDRYLKFGPRPPSYVWSFFIQGTFFRFKDMCFNVCPSSPVTPTPRPRVAPRLCFK